MDSTAAEVNQALSVENKTSSCRQRILQHLLENKAGLCIGSVAKHLNVSRNAVQQHFLMLETEGLIKKHELHRTKGRPSMRYILTDAGHDSFPKHYLSISTLLMQVLKDEMNSEQMDNYFRKMGVKLAAAYRSGLRGKTKSEQIKKVYGLMREMGFLPEVVEFSQSPVTEIRAYNCIYHSLARQFPELCSVDKAFIGELLAEVKAGDLELPVCIAKGNEYCSFKLTDK